MAETKTKGEVKPAPDTRSAAEKFAHLIGKRVAVGKDTDICEYVGADHLVTKHGSKVPFSEAKAAE